MSTSPPSEAQIIDETERRPLSSRRLRAKPRWSKRKMSSYGVKTAWVPRLATPTFIQQLIICNPTVAHRR